MTPRVSDFTLSPVAPEAFVGREVETALVVSRALRPQPPLQSLEGSSKIGRTSMLRHLHAITHGETPSKHVDPRSDSLIAPYIDLTFHSYARQGAQEVILRAIVQEIVARGFKARADIGDSEAIVEVAIAMEDLENRGYRFLLLVDHVEHLLTHPSDEDARAEWSDMATAVLGELNERIPIAVLLAFGATGPAKDLRAPARRLQMLETLDALSQILNRGDVTATTLGLLDDEEVRALARSATIPGVGSRPAQLTDEEVEWIVDLAGGHPLVMQNAGLKLFEARGKASFRTPLEDLERQLADPGLQGFLIDMFRRVGPLDDTDAALLEQLAEGEGAVEVGPDMRATLAEESLIVLDEQEQASMPSRALRGALRAYLAARDASTPFPAAGGEAHARISSPILSLRDDDLEQTLRLTRSEHALVRVLLDAGIDEIASRASLRDALGRNTVDSQLTQRLSILRGKIAASLGVADAIENVYGQGYRLIDADRYVLSDRHSQ
jgi:hypothetical protein